MRPALAFANFASAAEYARFGSGTARYLQAFHETCTECERDGGTPQGKGQSRAVRRGSKGAAYGSDAYFKRISASSNFIRLRKCSVLGLFVKAVKAFPDMGILLLAIFFGSRKWLYGVNEATNPFR